MNFVKTAAAGTLALATALGGSAAFAQDNSATPDEPVERVEIGVLDCVVEGGSGFIFGSTKDVSCTYRPADGGVEESYFGAISKFGIDIGKTDASYMTWAVFAPTNDDFAPGALAGDYYGVSAEATAGAGVGANALIGGSGETFSLQPLSVSSQTGLNFALAVSELELRSIAD
ncbi:DUF992 domain-containing protein [Oricola indica]|uniref:DUF992 domain-containing protein n=1 Tax=Oricola indica TaxID=2872591 RepID=UPI003CCB81E9